MKQAPVLEELKDLAVQTPGQKTLKKILKESLGISYMIAGDPKSDERLSKEIKDLSYYIKWGGACDTGAGVLQRNHTIYPVYFNSYDFNKLKDLIKKNPPFKIEEMDSKDHLWVEGEKENLGLWTNEAALSLNQKKYIKQFEKDLSTKVRIIENLQSETILNYESLLMVTPHFSSYSKNRVKELKEYLLDNMLSVSISTKNIEMFKTRTISIHAWLEIFYKDERHPFCSENLDLKDTI